MNDMCNAFTLVTGLRKLVILVLWPPYQKQSPQSHHVRGCLRLGMKDGELEKVGTCLTAELVLLHIDSLSILRNSGGVWNDHERR